MNFFLEACQNCILRVYRIILGKFFLKFFFSFSEPQRENISISSKNFWRGCENCVSRAQRIFVRKNDSFLKKIQCIFVFRILNEKVSNFCRKVFGIVVKTASYLSKVIVKEKLFIKNKRKFSSYLWNWAKKNSASEKNFPTGLSKMHSTCPKNSFGE